MSTESITFFHTHTLGRLVQSNHIKMLPGGETLVVGVTYEILH